MYTFAREIVFQVNIIKEQLTTQMQQIKLFVRIWMTGNMIKSQSNYPVTWEAMECVTNVWHNPISLPSSIVIIDVTNTEKTQLINKQFIDT